MARACESDIEREAILREQDTSTNHVFGHGKKTVIAVSFALLLVGAFAMALSGARAGPALVAPARKSLLQEVSATSAQLSQGMASTASDDGNDDWAPSCKCVTTSPTWMNTTRTVPKCIFIDLGAAGGNTLDKFLNNGYGHVSNCPSAGQWEAWLVEANPHFTDRLKQTEQAHPGLVHPLASTAAYACDDNVSFSLDGAVGGCDECGSSMKRRHFLSGPATQIVTVPTVNVNQLLAEHTIPEDYVILKIDIEGAEYDIFPCLANSPHAHLLDAIYLEEHPYLQSRANSTPTEYASAKATLHQMLSVSPKYFPMTYATMS